MNKKIITTFILLIVVISATLVFLSFSETSSDSEKNNYPSDENISEEDISEEFDDFFVSEDDEVDIGEML